MYKVIKISFFVAPFHKINANPEGKYKLWN